MSGLADYEETIKRFLTTSPPGEEEDVMKALKTITTSPVNPESLRASAYHDLHLNAYQVVQIPNTQEKFLLTPFGEIDPNHYIDPSGGRLVTFDHSSSTVQDVRQLGQAELSGHEGLRKSVENCFAAYLKQHYQHAVASVYASEAEGKKKAVVIALNSTRLNPTSMWGGRWKSTWVLVFKDGSEVTVNGTLEIACHFFEQGNVHLHTSDNKSFSIPWKKDQEELVKAIVGKIEVEEAAYEQAVDESFLRCSETSLRLIRMQLPRSKTLINWDTFALQGKVGK